MSHSTPAPVPSGPPPGWYQDPSAQATVRWWDGYRWTGHTSVTPPQRSIGPKHTSVTAPQPSIGPKGTATHYLLPTGRSVWAIAAGYLGLLSILLIFAPFAVGAGVVALRSISRRPELGGKGRAWFGIVAGALGTAGLITLLLGG